MQIAPFGVLHNDYKQNLKNQPGQAGILEPMPDWQEGKQAFETLMNQWLNDVTKNIWPAWQGNAWVGGAASNMAAATRDELKLAVRLYHGADGGPDVLTEAPHVADSGNSLRTHAWHYKIEDALIHDPQFLYLELPPGMKPSFEFQASKEIGSNYLAYDLAPRIDKFESDFWDRMGRIQPSIWDIKQHFQRPRPWSTATLLDVRDFRWIVAGGFFSTHTGVHPSLLSGHCIQGILGGCNVLDQLLDGGGGTADPARIRAIQQYMVDWGDRRVFAGVHYMTDNIASWTLARRLIPHLFKNPQQVEKLAVEAITRRSRVFADIVRHFDPASPARTMLIDYFPEALAAS